MDQGLKSNGHQTTTYYRKSIYAGQVANKKTSSKNRSHGFYGLILEVIRSWINSNTKVWIVHHPVMGGMSLLARKKKLIYICHGPWAGEARDISDKYINKKMMSRVRRFIQNLLTNNSNIVFFLSEYMQKEVSNELNSKANCAQKYRLIPPIAEVSCLDMVGLARQRHRRVSNQIYICRRLVKRTGVYDFLEKLALSPYKKNFNIIIAGDGPDKGRIKELIDRYSMQDCNVLGFVGEDKHKINYLTSEFMLLPSLTNEGFGLVIIEAIHHNCLPIISINAGGGAEWMKRTCENLVYDGSIEGIIRCVAYANQNKAEILGKLRVSVRDLTKENAASVIESVTKI